ncbi:MAG: hypothetical protein AAGA03_15075 [Planctomycetota bacterium]
MDPDVPSDHAQTWEYGRLRASLGWVVWILLATGILAFPIAWFTRDEIELAGNPLPAWAVLLVGVTVAIVGIGVSITLLRARSGSAKRIEIDNGQLHVPGGLLTGRAWSLPLADVTVRTIDLGFVRQLQLSCPRRRATLSSALFTCDAEFDRLVNALDQD